MQLPPVFSALKVNGKRAYDLARTGKEVKLEPRPVIIYKIDLLSYEYPKIALSCGVSKGTYIRSLGRDIGAALNTGAYLSELKRTKIGNLELSQAQELDKLSSDNILSYLINP